MPYAVGDLTVERRFRVIDAGPRLKKRQDPEPSATQSTPVEPTTSSAPVETTSSQPTSTTPTTSSTPAETSSAAPTSSTPVTSPTSTPIESSAGVTSTTPTDPVESSAVASQSSIPAASATSTQFTTSSTGAVGPSTRVITSFVTNGTGTVTVVFTSTSVGPTAAASNSGSSTNTGAIVGGVVGGVGGLLLLIALLWFIRRKTHKDKYEENMFAPDRNVDRGEMDLAGDDVHDPEAIARPYHLPPSPTRNEMAMSAGSRPLSAGSQPLSAQSYGRPLSGQYDEAATVGMSRPTSGMSSHTQPGSGIGMPVPMTMPMPMSRDHMAYAQSRGNSTFDHNTQTSEPTTSEGGSSSARLMKEREARRLHVANDDGGVIVHSDGGRVDEEAERDAPREIPPTYESISGPSGPR